MPSYPLAMNALLVPYWNGWPTWPGNSGWASVTRTATRFTATSIGAGVGANISTGDGQGYNVGRYDDFANDFEFKITWCGPWTGKVGPGGGD